MDARAQDAWAKSARRALRRLAEHDFGYADPRGDLRLRAAIADYLRAARAVACDPEQVIVTCGAQHAIDLAARVLLEPGDTVWVEDPGYPATWQALKSAGAQLQPVPVDRQGLDPAAGRAAAPHARMAVVTPSHQFPLGVTLSMARRLELIAWAKAAKAWIVEDDYASEFRFAGSPLASLQGLDGGERTIYVGTLNKALFPGLRMGYLVAPPALTDSLAIARHLMDRHPSTLTQAIVLDFIEGGHFAAHIRRRRIAYKAQRDALVSALQARLGEVLEVDAPDQGMSLIAYFRDGRDDVAVEEKVRSEGMAVRAISGLHHLAPPRSGLLLGFTGFPPEAMAPGVERLARLLGA
jgi:GntR family transcriptional regulator/MocR family aminotransferase